MLFQKSSPKLIFTENFQNRLKKLCQLEALSNTDQIEF
jgi:hypothetical protein